MKRTEAGIEAQRVSLLARERAYRRLAKLHSDEFSILYEEERKELGYVPRPLGRPKVKVDA